MDHLHLNCLGILVEKCWFPGSTSGHLNKNLWKSALFLSLILLTMGYTKVQDHCPKACMGHWRKNCSVAGNQEFWVPGPTFSELGLIPPPPFSHVNSEKVRLGRFQIPSHSADMMLGCSAQSWLWKSMLNPGAWRRWRTAGWQLWSVAWSLPCWEPAVHMGRSRCGLAHHASTAHSWPDQPARQASAKALGWTSCQVWSAPPREARRKVLWLPHGQTGDCSRIWPTIINSLHPVAPLWCLSLCGHIPLSKTVLLLIRHLCPSFRDQKPNQSFHWSTGFIDQLVDLPILFEIPTLCQALC